MHFFKYCNLCIHRLPVRRCQPPNVCNSIWKLFPSRKCHIWLTCVKCIIPCFGFRRVPLSTKLLWVKSNKSHCKLLNILIYLSTFQLKIDIKILFICFFEFRAIAIQKFLKWIGLIFGFIGIICSGLLFMVKQNNAEAADAGLPSPVNNIDVKSIEKSLS